MLWVTIPIRKLFVDEGQEDRLVFKHMIEDKDVNAAIVQVQTVPDEFMDLSL